MTDTAANINNNLSQASDLRLQGNTAFSSKDWETAIKHYEESISIDGKSKDSAKVYSNLAAALCKLSRYDEAYDAAKKGTKVNPGWAKGHWRLGVVSELQKDFVYALKSYEDAVKLSAGSPDEATFRKSASKMLSRLGYEGKDLPNGVKVVSSRTDTGLMLNQTPPLYIAWERLKKETNNLSESEMGNAFPEYFDPNSEDYIKSDKWIALGMYKWYCAMKRLLGDMVNLPYPHPQIAAIKQQLASLSAQKEGMSTGEYHNRQSKITGCPLLKGDEFEELFNAVLFLSGDHLAFESGGGKIIPSPKWLTWCLPQQMVAMTMVLYNKTATCMDILGDDMLMSRSLFTNQSTFFGNSNQKSRKSGGKEGSPQEVINYCKKKLAEGVTWDGGMRDYIAFLYRGTALHGFQIRMMMGQLGLAMKDFKWAREFITLADKEWNVSKEGTYEEKGNTFDKASQICILSMELTTARTIQGNMPTKKQAEDGFNLAQEIITIAKNESLPADNNYNSWLMDAAYRRKPLANACTHIAGTMNAMLKDAYLLLDVMQSTGIMDTGRDDKLYSFLDGSVTQTTDGNLNSIIAETYKHAAISQLDDDNECPILWWGYAAHMCQAGGYRIRDLRYAINKAVDSSQKRDKELFGPEIWRGSTFQRQALMLERYYESKDDDFILPPLQLSQRPDGSIALFVEGNVLAMNFDKLMKSEERKFEHNRPGKKRDEFLDTSEVEKVYGAGKI